MAFDAYHAAVKRLEGTITPQGYMTSTTADQQQFFLDRTQRFFDTLGNPEKGFKIIHITGTSGKGSTTAMTYQSLLAGNKTVGCYTSPYVSTIIENIEANGFCIDPNDFARITNATLDIVDTIRAHEPKWVPSYGEIIFGIAMQYFKEQNVEWVVIEVGCGGRFDKTNVVPAPVAVGITSVGYDHTDILGNTLESIAWHKSGIIKRGTGSVWSTEPNTAIQAVLNREAEACDITIHYKEAAQDTDEPIETFETTMPGNHQQKNAWLAANLCRSAGISEEAIATGIARAQLPARLEKMQSSPTVIIDGAHSEPKIKALVETLQSFRPFERLILVFTAKETKDLDHILDILLPHADIVIPTEFHLPGFSSFACTDIATHIKEKQPHIECAPEPDAQKAIEHALAIATPHDLIISTGSLYLAGKVRKHWISEDQILTQRTVFPS